MIDLAKLKKLGKEWSKNGHNRIYLNLNYQARAMFDVNIFKGWQQEVVLLATVYYDINEKRWVHDDRPGGEKETYEKLLALLDEFFKI